MVNITNTLIITNNSIIEYQLPLGGLDQIVEVDEIEFGTKQKGGKGHDTSDSKKMTLIEYDRASHVFYLTPTEDYRRDASTLVKIMMKYLNNSS